MTLKNNRAPLLCFFQLCAWFHCHMWIQTGVRVRKRLSWVLTSVTLTFDLWPWPFAWTSLLTMVITPENFMMIRWWEHGEKGVTDRQTDGQTENTICRAAWSQLKIYLPFLSYFKTEMVEVIEILPSWMEYSGLSIDLARNGNSGCANETSGCAKCHFWWISPWKLKNFGNFRVCK